MMYDPSMDIFFGSNIGGVDWVSVKCLAHLLAGLGCT